MLCDTCTAVHCVLPYLGTPWFTLYVVNIRLARPAGCKLLFQHQLDVAEEVKKRGGRHLLKMPHGGARKRTAGAIEAARKK